MALVFRHENHSLENFARYTYLAWKSPTPMLSFSLSRTWAVESCGDGKATATATKTAKTMNDFIFDWVFFCLECWANDKMLDDVPIETDIDSLFALPFYSKIFVWADSIQLLWHCIDLQATQTHNTLILDNSQSTILFSILCICYYCLSSSVSFGFLCFQLILVFGNYIKACYVWVRWRVRLVFNVIDIAYEKKSKRDLKYISFNRTANLW